MQETALDRKKTKDFAYGIVLVLSLLAVLLVMYLMTGKWPLYEGAYNTYALQADSWRQGRLDLLQDYPWLELCIYNGKYYSGFPPFPSYILFPFTFLLGSHTPDGILLLIFNILTVIYLYKTGLLFEIKQEYSVLGALFLTVGSNALFCMIDPAVWFFAQNLSFLLAVISIYYALKGKGGLSLLSLVCSAGCRPMQAVFLPVIILILWKREIKEKQRTLLQAVKQRWKWVLPGGFVALSYMALNYARFGSIFDFGRNYFPEFSESEHGEFSSFYFLNNLRMLFDMPEINENGRMVINQFGSLCILLVSPVVLYFTALLFYHLVWKESGFKIRIRESVFPGLILLCACCYMCIVLFHKSMGGFQFGNRYANDILPWIYAGICFMVSKHQWLVKWQIPLFLFGLCLNVVGTITVYNGW